MAAGVTGTIPSVARLLAVIARLPQGCVVLPALDRAIDERAGAVGPSHPQYGLKRLLERMAIDRAAVRAWPEATTARPPPRGRAVVQVLRPAATTEAWRREASLKPEARAGLELARRRHRRRGVQIALRLREALETPGKRAVLVTPNRFLGRRVAAELLRWGIRVDDSAGVPLDQSPPGSFLLLTAHLVAGGRRR